MRTSKWWWNQQIEYPPQAIIIFILISNDKTVISLGHGDQTIWPVYITIGNLDAKTRQSQKRPGILFLDSILIIYKRSEDGNNKDKNLKTKIYYMALKTILQRTYSSFLSVSWLEENKTLMMLQYDLSIQKMALNWYVQTGLNIVTILYLQVLW